MSQFLKWVLFSNGYFIVFVLFSGFGVLEFELRASFLLQLHLQPILLWLFWKKDQDFAQA
jgi:hypothetical protein